MHSSLLRLSVLRSSVLRRRLALAAALGSSLLPSALDAAGHFFVGESSTLNPRYLGWLARSSGRDNAYTWGWHMRGGGCDLYNFWQLHDQSEPGSGGTDPWVRLPAGSVDHLYLTAGQSRDGTLDGWNPMLAFFRLAATGSYPISTYLGRDGSARTLSAAPIGSPGPGNSAVRLYLWQVYDDRDGDWARRPAIIRGLVEAQANELNARRPAGTRPVAIIPLNDAIRRLRDDTLAGTFPNGRALSYFYDADAVHLNAIGTYYSALCHFAVVYNASPVGLTNEIRDPATNALLVTVPSAEAARLQQLAWEVCSAYARTGIGATTPPDTRPAAASELLLRESFNYPVGSLHQQAAGTFNLGWSVWDPQWESQSSTPFQVASATPLSYSIYPASGNYATATSAWVNIGRRLDTTGGGPFGPWLRPDPANAGDYALGGGTIGKAGTTLFVAYVVRKLSANDNDAWLGFNRGSQPAGIDGHPGFGYFGTASNSGGQRLWSLRAADGATVTRSSATVTSNSATLLVLRLRFGASGASTLADLWVNPASLGGAAPAPTLANVNLGEVHFRNVFYYGGGSSTVQSHFDEIRFASSYAAATATPGTPPPTPGSLAFSASTLSRTEGNTNGAATLSVNRSGGSSGAVSVAYATANGSASAGSDYTATSGTLSWGAGDTAAKTISVPITGDTLVEPSETFTVTLSSPGGGATLGSPSTATVTLTNDDSTPGSGSVVYTDRSAFLAALAPGAYTETFAATPSGVVASRSYSGGGFAYTIRAASGNVEVGGSAKVMAAWDALTRLDVTFTSGNVRAVGGDFFCTDWAYNFVPGSVTVTLSDGTTRTFSPSSASQAFTGFIAPVGTMIGSIRISPGNDFSSLDNLVVGTAP